MKQRSNTGIILGGRYHMIALPENWSDWAVVGELGRGAYSVVYEAERKDDSSVRCAIKVITIPQDESEYDDLVADGFNTMHSRSFFEAAVRDFTREIKLMEQFKGMQNIVSIEDYKVIPKEDGVGSCIYIRMELLTSLEKYISDKTLTEEEIIQIGIDICTALEYCQEKKIVHRDIKPANIFVNDRLGTHVFYKLGDFGIARNLEGRTQGLSSKGTPNYMAPEVAACRKYDGTADLYSLGLTLYWLMNANRLPFFPQTQLYSPAAKREALQRRLSGEPLVPPVRASAELSGIILKACSYQPEERYQSAGEMRAALERLLRKDQQAPVSDTEAASASSKREPAGSRKKSLLIALPVLAACLGLGIFLLLDQGREKQFPEYSPAPAQETAAVTGEPEGKETPPVSPEGSPEPTETPAAQTRITGFFKQLESKESGFQKWLEQIRPDQVMLVKEWKDIPLLPDLSSAPGITAEIKDNRLHLAFDEPASHGRQVQLRLGSREVPVREENGAYRAELPEGTSLNAALILVTYQSGRDTLEYQYELQDAEAPACIRAGLARETESGTIRTTENLYEPGTCEIRADQNWVTAYYTDGQLEQYEDHSANCIYNRQGYLIAGEPEAGTLSPVVLASESFTPEEGPDDVLLKKMQSMLSRTKEIIAYNGSGSVFLPAGWSGLGIGSLSTDDAPAVSLVKREEAYELQIEGGGTKWKRNTDHSVLFREGEQPPETFELEIDSSEKEETDHFWCIMTYQMHPDLTATCISVAYDYYSFYDANKSDLPVKFSISRFMYRPCAFSVRLNPDTGTEECEYFFNNWVDHPNEEGSYNSFLFTASYQRWPGGDEMQLTGCRATIGHLGSEQQEEFSLALPAAGRQAVPCVQKVQGRAVVLEQTMDSARLAWPLSALLNGAADEDAPKIETAEGPFEVHQYRGETGTWYVQAIRNTGNQPAAVAEISHPLFENGLLRCIPSVIMPGTTAWIISDRPEMNERLFLVSDSRLSAEALSTAPSSQPYEKIDYSIREDVRIFSVRNDLGHDVYGLEYLYFIRDRDGTPVGVCTDRKEKQSPYVLRDGQEINLLAYKEGVDLLQAWGYPDE